MGWLPVTFEESGDMFKEAPDHSFVSVFFENVCLATYTIYINKLLISTVVVRYEDHPRKHWLQGSFRTRPENEKADGFNRSHCDG